MTGHNDQTPKPWNTIASALQIVFYVTANGRPAACSGCLDTVKVSVEVNPGVRPTLARLAFLTKGAKVETGEAVWETDAGVVLRHPLHVLRRQACKGFGNSGFE